MMTTCKHTLQALIYVPVRSGLYNKNIISLRNIVLLRGACYAAAMPIVHCPSCVDETLQTDKDQVNYCCSTDLGAICFMLPDRKHHVEYKHV